MPKIPLFTFFFIFFLLLGSSYILAQDTFSDFSNTSDTSPIPSSIKKYCLLTQEGYIDTCPLYWTKIKTINEMFSGIRNKQEKIIQTKDIFMAINRFLLQLQAIKKDMYMTKRVTEENVFIVDYLLYLTTLYKKEIGQRSHTEGSINSLFSKTYYNTQQSGLVITNIGLFEPNKPLKVYDEQLVVQISLRNFEQKPITTIEDIYCFVTVGQKDYIFPLGVGQLPIGANTIQKIVGTIKFTNTDVTSVPGPQDMYCMLVYTDEQKNEITTPFYKLPFIVE